jgi:hypothetical protein
MKLQTSIFLFIACILMSSGSFAQPEIKGSSCVISSTLYDYLISGNPDSVAEISICIKGGVFVANDADCMTIKPQSSVKVIWDKEVKNASLTISSKFGKSSLDVGITGILDPGEIVATVKRQSVRYDSASAQIICSPAKGGSCSPKYVYQWQHSANALSWSDVNGAMQQNLPPQNGLKEAVFYRRKVTEITSGTVGYSSRAVAYVEM